MPAAAAPDAGAEEAGKSSDLGALLLVFVLCAPLVLRRRYPLAVLWANIGGALLVLVPDDAIQRPNLYASVVLTCLIVIYSAAAHSPYRLAALLSLPLIVLAVTAFRQIVIPGGYCRS